MITAAFVLLIFSQSMLPAELSSGESTYALTFVGSLLDKAGIPGVALTEHLIRKSAHFMEYATFAVLFTICMNVYRYDGEKKWLRILSACVIVPFIDESIQLFTPGRSSQVTDIWIDIAGAVTGILIITIICVIKNTTSKKMTRDEAEKI